MGLFVCMHVLAFHFKIPLVFSIALRSLLVVAFQSIILLNNDHGNPVIYPTVPR